MDYLNKQMPNILFTILNNTETEGHLPFLDPISRKDRMASSTQPTYKPFSEPFQHLSGRNSLILQTTTATKTWKITFFFLSVQPDRNNFCILFPSTSTINLTYFIFQHYCAITTLWTPKNWALPIQRATFWNYNTKFRSRLKWCTYSNIPFIWQTWNQTHARLSASTHTDLNSWR